MLSMAWFEFDDRMILFKSFQKLSTELNFILRKAHLRRTQAGPGRTVWLQQEQSSPTLERRIKSTPV